MSLSRHKKVLILVLLVLGALSSLAATKAQLSGEALTALEEAQIAADEARATYAGSVSSPDQPLWREALRAGERALRLAPGSPQVLRFLTETYSDLSWDVRAWDYGQRYLEATGDMAGEAGSTLDADLLASLIEAGTQLGYARYNAGDLAGAAGYFEEVLELEPQSSTPNIWLGRIYLEQGEPERALPYWQAAAELAPDDEGVQFYLSQTEAQLEFGAAAGGAFQRGLQAYNEERLEDALALFEEAAQSNPDYKAGVRVGGPHQFGTRLL